jgi:hypothetical protein
MTLSKAIAVLFRLSLFIMMAAAVIIVAVVGVGRAMFAKDEASPLGGEEDAINS